MKHKHHDCIVAWAEGKQIQAKFHTSKFWEDWDSDKSPNWFNDVDYRIKPEPKPDIVQLKTLYKMSDGQVLDIVGYFKLTYCGETGALKSAEVI